MSQQWTVTRMNSAAIRQNNAKLADGGPAMALVDRLSKLDAPDRTTAATILKIRDAFASVKPCIALLRAKEASK